MIESKAWNWAELSGGGIWDTPADEFLPAALRWHGADVRTALDLGSGRGRHALLLARLGISVTALELSEAGLNALEEAASLEGLAGICAVCDDMVGWDYPEAEYDAVVAFHSLYHTDLEGLRAVLAGVLRTLRPGGHFYLTLNSKASPSYADPTARIVDEYTRVKTRPPEEGVPHTYLAYEDLPVFLAGFEIRSVRHIQDWWQGHTGLHYFVECVKA